MHGERCHHITVANCRFESGTGWINCRFDEAGDSIRITDSYFTGGTDLVSIDGGDGHLVEGNFFGDASHTGLVFLGVQRSVVRDNTMTNRRWRCMEVESQRHEPYRKSMYNLIENNTFDYTPTLAVQYAGNYSILRRNIFRRCLTGMAWSNYLGSAKTPEAWHNEHNRFYNNVIAECGLNDIVTALIAQAESDGFPVEERVAETGYGMVFATNMFNPPLEDYPDCAYGDNVVVNNVFYKNGNAAERSDSKGTTASRTVQVGFDWNASPEFARFHYNAFYSGETDADAFYFCDAAYQDPAEPRNRSVSDFHERYPEWATGNIETEPSFTDPGNGDYTLSPDSPLIDAGGPLTHAITGGEGTILKVEDALYFSDGCGLIEPDVIRIGSMRAEIDAIDYETNTITLKSGVSWQSDASVYLDFSGDAPDIGYYEYPGGSGVGIDRDDSPCPRSITLAQNHPNPFNPSTTIEYVLPSCSRVILKVFNSAGQSVHVLRDCMQEPGEYAVSWNASGMPSGVYYCALTTDGMTRTKKMLLLK